MSAIPLSSSSRGWRRFARSGGLAARITLLGAGLLCCGAWAAPAAQGPGASDICTVSPHKTLADALGSGPQAPTATPVSVTLPDVALRSAQGTTEPLGRRIRTGDAVLLNFIYTSCTSICPPMAQIFAATQERLGTRASPVQMISISIDPEHDTPRRLQAFAASFGAGPQWSFHTGSQAAIDRVQRAFQVWRPDKMGHTPVTFIKPSGRDDWLRVDGFATPHELLALAFEPTRR